MNNINFQLTPSIIYAVKSAAYLSCRPSTITDDLPGTTCSTILPRINPVQGVSAKERAPA